MSTPLSSEKSIPLYDGSYPLTYLVVFAYFGSPTTLSIYCLIIESSGVSTIEVSPSMSVLEWIRVLCLNLVENH